MHLRIFANPQNSLLVEISHEMLTGDHKWVVPMLPIADMSRRIHSDRLLEVWFDGKKYTVPYVVIRTIRSNLPLKQIGVLAEDDSRNILNHIRDLMAWDQ